MKDSTLIIQDTIYLYDTINIQVIEQVTYPDSTLITKPELACTAEHSDPLSSNILPIIAILVAIGALIISWKAFKNSRKHGTLSVKPLLIFREQTSHPSGKAKLYIANKGLGPLTFIDFSMEYEGKTYKKMYHLYSAVIKKFGYNPKDFVKNAQTYTNPLDDYSLQTQEEKTIIKYHLKDKSFPQAKEFYNEFKQIQFSYSYVDLYDNKVEGTHQFNN